jgi:hypothetical protein
MGYTDLPKREQGLVFWVKEAAAARFPVLLQVVEEAFFSVLVS